MTSAYVFFGFSGNPKTPWPEFPDGTDTNLSWQLVASTLATCIRNISPDLDVHVVQSWTKDKIISALSSAPSPVEQVHIVSHADATGISLAYHFDGRLDQRVLKYLESTDPEDVKAVAALKEEDALLSGYFTRGLDEAGRDSLTAKLAPESSWQIWGCWSGFPATQFGHADLDAERRAYFDRFNFGQSSVPGIAMDIATSLGVYCTAARDGWGLSVWHGTTARQIVPNPELHDKTPAVEPFWLWNTKGSQFVTYTPGGSVREKPLILGSPREPIDIPAGRPPTWLTDSYWGEQP